MKKTPTADQIERKLMKIVKGKTDLKRKIKRKKPEQKWKVKCWGEAHRNPYIDHCSICMPHWAYVVMTTSQIKEVEKKLNTKLVKMEEIK